MLQNIKLLRRMNFIDICVVLLESIVRMEKKPRRYAKCMERDSGKNVGVKRGGILPLDLNWQEGDKI